MLLFSSYSRNLASISEVCVHAKQEKKSWLFRCIAVCVCMWIVMAYQHLGIMTARLTFQILNGRKIRSAVLSCMLHVYNTIMMERANSIQQRQMQSAR